MGLDLIYLATLFLASPFLFYRAIRYRKYRDGWGQRFFGFVPKLAPKVEGRKRVWFHAVSVGEVNLLQPIVAALDASNEDWEFVVSSTSKTGYELAKTRFGARTSVFYCPLDLTWAVKRAMRRVAPDALVLVELELWPNLIAAAKKAGARVAIVNGRVSDDSLGTYLRVKRFLASTFRRIDLIVAQDDRAADAFRSLAPSETRIEVSGSIKFDGVQTDRDNPKTRELGRLAGIAPTDVVFLCGSSQAPEEEGALEVYRRLYRSYPDLKLILVPRHKERFEEVARLLDASEFAWTRRSLLSADASGERAEVALNDPASDPRRVILVDAMGELGAWWGLADVAFVGGSWGSRGGQNMLEPAAYGAAVSFGPNTRNFQTIVDALLRARGALVVPNVEALALFVTRCLEEPQFRSWMGECARRLVLQNRGATKRTLELLIALLR